MIVNLQKLLRLPVYTESEIKLGRVFDLELDVTSQSVLRYLVRPNFLSPKSFLISSSQVKEIKNDRIVVYDDTLKVEATAGQIAAEE
ncbi:MAG TPA: PRC-barrel domain-containing protein [Candidatus Udaeobacter sp.]|nr:PRC-barrel domain-containing protein [Candidatus Udaeobacter sp.]